MEGLTAPHILYLAIQLFSHLKIKHSTSSKICKVRSTTSVDIYKSSDSQAGVANQLGISAGRDIVEELSKFKNIKYIYFHNNH